MLDKKVLNQAYQAMIAHGPRCDALEKMLEEIGSDEWIISVRLLALRLLMDYEAERRKHETTDDGSRWILNKTIKLICDQTEADETLGDPESIFRRSLIASQRMLENRSRF